MKKIAFIALSGVLAFSSCDTSKKTTTTKVATEKATAAVVEATPPPAVEVPEVLVTAPKKDTKDYTLPTYNASMKRTLDLIHTKLDVRFDWAKQYIIGKAILTIKPYFYDTDVATLDAKGFEIKSINFEGQTQALKYEYDGEVLKIQLGKMYNRNQEFKLVIDYIGKPEERKTGGSAAITSDKGLYFINPKNTDPNKPMQIWTQGETQSNSVWMPTIDNPIERSTEEITMTVEDKYKTLSNGLLISSKKNADGTRTDYWKMDKPHPPYLFMMAVGDFAVVKDKWNDIEIQYWVEPKFEKDARAIFPYSPEILTFFSDKLGVKYPWQKLAHIVVRDYVSGAMENTTAIIYGDFMQKTTRELIDEETNELVEAHETFHHWFGDLVTCESWPNLTLNEGFANYSEYLWLEHKYGADAMDRHRLTELGGYLGQAKRGTHNLINFSYKDREDMFDAHSYNKGGLVLHQLRNYLGDDAFFTSLKNYLTKNAGTDVEAHELRMAFEDTVGEDLNWFFNQWFYAAGHPVLNVTKDYDEATKKLSVTVEQQQDAEKSPAIFQLPIAIDIYTNGKATRQKIKTTARKQTFTFDVASKPDLVDFDADKVLLAEVEYKQSEAENLYQFYHAPKYLDRHNALVVLQASKSPDAQKAIKDALNDKDWSIRAKALSIIGETKDADALAKIAQLAEKDAHSMVRSNAFDVLAKTGDAKYANIAKQAIDKDQSYNTLGSALQTLYSSDKAQAMTYAKKLEKEENPVILQAVASLYAENPSIENLAFFEKNITKADGMDAVGFMGSYARVASKSDDANILNKCLDKMKTIGTDQTLSVWKRYAAAKTLNDLRMNYKTLGDEAKVSSITTILKELKAKETDEQLKGVYNMFQIQ